MVLVRNFNKGGFHLPSNINFKLLGPKSTDITLFPKNSGVFQSGIDCMKLDGATLFKLQGEGDTFELVYFTTTTMKPQTADITAPPLINLGNLPGGLKVENSDLDSAANIFAESSSRDKRKSVALLAEPVEYGWVNLCVFAGPCIQNADGSFSKVENEPREGKPPFLSKIFCKRQKSKQILRNVTGVAYTGQLLALMGSSGAGKTTLLNLLMFRTSLDVKVCGERKINGVPIGKGFLTAISGYVQQEDLFPGHLTVKEHLMFQALFRMDKHLTPTDREIRVLEIIEDCGLQKCISATIGSPGIKKGISGGERRRLAFAAEMITDPAILFCDEPTSGLDYFTAQKIVLLLQRMAATGKTIICTIHQPSSDIFAIFDRILLMAEGRTAFQGTREDALSFFAEQGMVCPSTYNPGDFFLENLSVMSVGEETVPHPDRREFIEEICNHYDQSQDSAEMKAALSVRGEKSGEFEALERKIKEQESKSIVYKASSWNQFKALQIRALYRKSRDLPDFAARLIQLAIVAGIFAMVYFCKAEEALKTPRNTYNINGALFLFVVQMSMNSIFGVINTFCEELPLFLREKSNQLYRTTFYFISKNVADLPIQLLTPVLFSCIVYFPVGLKPDMLHFIWFTFILTLVVHTAASFSYSISCATGEVQAALASITALIAPVIIFGGTFVDAERVPAFLAWIKYVSWIYYATEIVFIKQWNKPNEAVILFPYKFDPKFLQRDLWGLISLAVALRLFSYFMLLLNVRRMTRFQ